MGGDIPCLDPGARRSGLLCWFHTGRRLMDSSLPRPDPGWLRPILWSWSSIPMAATNSGFPNFDPLPLRSSRRGRFRTDTVRGGRAALPGGDRLPRLDPRRVLGGRLCGRLLGRGRLCGGAWLLLRRLALALFLLFQQDLYPALRATLCPPRSACGGVLDPVAAVVAGLPTLGGIPKLAPQAFRTIIQPTADKLFRRSLDFFL